METGMSKQLVPAVIFAAACAAALPSNAMEFELVRMPGMVSQFDMVTISAMGDIMEGDDLRLLELMIAYSDAKSANDPATPIVEFNSPGGDPIAAMDLGRMIRALGLPTTVPGDAGCASACTQAFLGGTERTVAGLFEVHAVTDTQMTPEIAGNMLPEALRERVDVMQQVASALLDYERDMLGTTHMMEATFTVPSSTINWIPDDLLRDFGIITSALRPEQQLPFEGALARCGDTAWVADVGVPSVALCYSIVNGRKAQAIDAALATLNGKPLGDEEIAEQEAFEKYWTRTCVSEPEFDGDMVTAVHACVANAFATRAAELDSLLAYYDIDASDPGNRWRAPR
jgi:hypothetical protein